MNHKLFSPQYFLKACRKHKLQAIGVVALILIAAGTAVYFLLARSVDRTDRIDASTPQFSDAEQVPVDTRVVAPLSGELVEPDLAKRPVTAIVIENSPEARPQSGLDQASIVFEAIAEGGITRFVALYQHTRPEVIGPVRSLRPYFIDWSLMYDAPIAHVGGSTEAIDQARAIGIRDIDEFSYTNSFYRSTNRYAPHNVYTDFELLDARNEAAGHTTSSFEALKRKDDSPISAPKASSITLDVSGPLYRVNYVYDPDANSYLRSVGGKPHIDRETSDQLSSKVVVALVVPRSVRANGTSVYQLVGSGQAVIFQDGKVIAATWQRSSQSDQFAFSDAAQQKAVSFNAGSVWMTAVDSRALVTYQADASASQTP